MKTVQLEHWESDFGREYTDRNSLTPEALDDLYRKNYGVTRSELNQRFLADMPRDARILEVGCNEGNQLCALRRWDFSTYMESKYRITRYAKLGPGWRMPNSLRRPPLRFLIPTDSSILSLPPAC